MSFSLHAVVVKANDYTLVDECIKFDERTMQETK